VLAVRGIITTGAQHGLNLATKIKDIDIDDRGDQDFLDAETSVIQTAEKFPFDTLLSPAASQGSARIINTALVRPGEANYPPASDIPNCQNGLSLKSLLRDCPLKVEITARIKMFLPFFDTIDVKTEQYGYREIAIASSLPKTTTTSTSTTSSTSSTTSTSTSSASTTSQSTTSQSTTSTTRTTSQSTTSTSSMSTTSLSTTSQSTTSTTSQSTTSTTSQSTTSTTSLSTTSSQSTTSESTTSIPPCRDDEGGSNCSSAGCCASYCAPRSSDWEVIDLDQGICFCSCLE